MSEQPDRDHIIHTSTSISLTRTECVEILHNVIQETSPEIDPRQVRLHDINLTTNKSVMGFLGEYYCLKLIYFIPYFSGEKAYSVQLFVKSLPQFSAEKEKNLIFTKESNLYSNCLKELKKNSSLKWYPLCFYARSNLLVLEDLSISGYICSKTHYLEQENMLKVLKSVAAMHASSIVYEDQTNFNIGLKFENFLKEITVSTEIAWFTTGIKTLVDLAVLHPDYQDDRMQMFIRTNFLAYLETVYDMVNPSEKYRNVFCHRDCWSGNILFPKTVSTCSENAILVDFQTSRYCPPVIDLILVIYMNLERAQRTAMATKYIDFYCTQFLKYLQQYDVDLAKFTTHLDELQRSYKEFERFGMVYNAIAATILRVPPEFVTNDYKYVSRTKCLTQYQQINSEFRDYMQQCVSDILEFQLHNIK